MAATTQSRKAFSLRVSVPNQGRKKKNYEKHRHVRRVQATHALRMTKANRSVNAYGTAPITRHAKRHVSRRTSSSWVISRLFIAMFPPPKPSAVPSCLRATLSCPSESSFSRYILQEEAQDGEQSRSLFSTLRFLAAYLSRTIVGKRRTASPGFR